VISAIYNDRHSEHYVIVPHHGQIKNIPADWTVEMTCRIGRDGAKPDPRLNQFDEKVLGYIIESKIYKKYAKGDPNGAIEQYDRVQHAKTYLMRQLLRHINGSSVFWTYNGDEAESQLELDSDTDLDSNFDSDSDFYDVNYDSDYDTE
jgi:hypothetical protein